MRKPHYFKQKKCWYYRDARGKLVRLHEEEEKAYQIWQRIVDAGTSLNHPAVSFAAIAAAWLAEYKLRLSAENFKQIKRRLKSFTKHIGNKQAKDVRASTVLAWTAANNWGGWASRHGIAAVKRVYRWAHNEGLLPVNPLASMPLKEPAYRSRVITADEHRQLIEGTRLQPGGRQFALLLIASHCGARPQQIRRVTLANVHASGTAWVFIEHKTAEDTGKHLTVYLTPCLQTITKILAANRKPGEPLFRQESGKPWSKDTVSRRFRRLRERLGLSGVVVYCYRHTFATDALVAEVPIATVATLLGHTDTRMVSKVYGHLESVQQHLVDAAGKAAGRRLTPPTHHKTP